MAILKYVPPTKRIIDNRKPEGGYYEAECEVCGTTFYPERSNAKYCTPNCGLIAHRIAVANGTAEKRPTSKVKKKATKEKQPKKDTYKSEKPIDYSKLSIKELTETAATYKTIGEKVPSELMETLKRKYQESVGTK